MMIALWAMHPCNTMRIEALLGVQRDARQEQHARSLGQRRAVTLHIGAMQLRQRHTAALWPRPGEEIGMCGGKALQKAQILL